jgi:hypothetical protein
MNLNAAASGPAIAFGLTMDERDTLDNARSRARALVSAALALHDGQEDVEFNAPLGLTLAMALEELSAIDATFDAMDARQDKQGKPRRRRRLVQVPAHGDAPA